MSIDQIVAVTEDGAEHDLDTCVARGVDGIAGMLRVPEKRGKNLVIPGNHGELHVSAKKHAANTIILTPWVRGVLSDGSVPEDTAGRRFFMQSLRALVSIFTEGELVALRHMLADGETREIVGEVTDVIEPELSGFGRYLSGQMAIALNCAAPFWSDLDPVSETVTLATGGTATLGAFGGATAPMEDLLVVFGQQNNPRLTQSSTGTFVQLDRVITSGQTITIDTSAFEVYGSAGVAPGLYEDLSYGGRRTSRWFALEPEPGGGAPVVRLDHTGGGSRTVTVTGKRKYKIG